MRKILKSASTWQIGAEFNRLRAVCRLEKFFFSFLLIAGLNILVFSPALNHYFYGDDFPSLAQYQYKLPQLGPNDPSRLLFRPLFHATTYMEYVLFKTNCFLWNLAGLLMHLGVLFILLKLLRRLTSPAAAFFLAAGFSCGTLGSQAVTWASANSYMPFFAGTFGLFYFLLSYAQNPNKAVFLKVFILASMCCFSYELGALSALLSFFYLWRVDKICRRAALMFLPIILYLALYFIFNQAALGAIHQYPHLTAPGQNLNQPRLITALTLAPFLIGWWLLGILLPVSIVWGMPSKVGRLIFNVASPSFSFPYLLNFLIFVLIAALFLLALSKARARKYAGLIVLVILSALFYVFAVAAGRGTVNGFDYTFRYNAYYVYLFSGYLVILAGALLEPAKFSAGIKKVAWGVSIIFVLLNAFYTFKLNYYLKAESKIFRQYSCYLATFINAHKDETGFSFWVEHDKEIFFTSPSLSLAPLLCDPRYLNKKNPKYVLDMTESDFYKEYLREVAKPQKAWYNY